MTTAATSDCCDHQREARLWKLLYKGTAEQRDDLAGYVEELIDELRPSGSDVRPEATND